MAVTKLVFTKDWRDPDDFPTVETSESRVREDMQVLHNEAKDKINEIIDALWDGESGGAPVESGDVKGIKVVDGSLYYTTDGTTWVPATDVSERVSSEDVKGLKADNAVLYYTLDGTTYVRSGPTFSGGGGSAPTSGDQIKFSGATITELQPTPTSMKILIVNGYVNSEDVKSVKIQDGVFSYSTDGTNFRKVGEPLYYSFAFTGDWNPTWTPGSSETIEMNSTNTDLTTEQLDTMVGAVADAMGSEPPTPVIIHVYLDGNDAEAEDIYFYSRSVSRLSSLPTHYGGDNCIVQYELEPYERYGNQSFKITMFTDTL